jgi:predicted RNase H-like HicB family nuclease
MKNEYTAVVKQEDDMWIGWIEEVPGVNCQEKTYEELKDTLEVTLKEALKFNRQDALNTAGSGVISTYNENGLIKSTPHSSKSLEWRVATASPPDRAMAAI